MSLLVVGSRIYRLKKGLRCLLTINDIRTTSIWRLSRNNLEWICSFKSFLFLLGDAFIITFSPGVTRLGMKLFNYIWKYALVGALMRRMLIICFLGIFFCLFFKSMDLYQRLGISSVSHFQLVGNFCTLTLLIYHTKIGLQCILFGWCQFRFYRESETLAIFNNKKSIWQSWLIKLSNYCFFDNKKSLWQNRLTKLSNYCFGGLKQKIRLLFVMFINKVLLSYHGVDFASVDFLRAVAFRVFVTFFVYS